MFRLHRDLILALLLRNFDFVRYRLSLNLINSMAEKMILRLLDRALANPSNIIHSFNH